LQSYRLFIKLTSATILDFKGSRPKTEVERARSPNSCDSANAYTSLAPATEVEGTPGTDTDKLQQQPRTRHRTKLGTQWDRSGLRPTWGHFLSRSVETPESVITTIAFQQGGTAKNKLFTANACRPTVSAVSDPATQATPENRPFYGTIPKPHFTFVSVW
jgi:hypothetical protein